MRAYRGVLLAVCLAGGMACGGESGDAGGGAATPTSPSSSSCPGPSAPGNLQAAVTGTAVAFSWSAVSGARDYELFVGSGPGSSNVLSTNTTQTSYNWNGIPRGTYYARVEARNSCGNGRASNEVTITIG